MEFIVDNWIAWPLIVVMSSLVASVVVVAIEFESRRKMSVRGIVTAIVGLACVAGFWIGIGLSIIAMLVHIIRFAVGT